MDLARFGLSRRPFRPNPDPTSYVPRESAAAALGSLHQALARREALALLDGEAGVGKTLIALKFLADIDAELPRVFVPAARLTRPADLFQTLLFDAGEPYAGRGEHELRLAVTETLLKSIIGGPTVLVLDEAQHLSGEVLEELRLLGNLSGRFGSALFTVLVAQPGLRQRLAESDNAGFAQRLGARLNLAAMTEAESEEYLAAQLRFGGDGDASAITAEARGVLAASCGGVPRVLNHAAGAALEVAANAGESAADVEAVSEALGELGLEAREPGGELPEVEADAPARQKSGRRRSA